MIARIRRSRRVSWIFAFGAVAWASCGGPEQAAPGAAAVSTPAPPSPGPIPSPSPVTGPLAVEVLGVGECQVVPVPHHGAIPRSDDSNATGERGAIHVTIRNLHGACPDVPTFSVTNENGLFVLLVTHLAPGAPAAPYQAPCRDVDVRITGVAAGTRAVAIRHSDTPEAGMQTFSVAVE